MSRWGSCAAAVGLLAVTVPVWLVAAGLLWLESSGSIFFRSARYGQGGRVFTLLRFRTMRSVNGRLQFTRLGRALRNVSVDELPQLFNVVAGDLNLVGPRPMEVERVDPADPPWPRILTVRPGLISYAILRLGRRYNAAPLEDKQALELEYVARRSLLFDLKLIGQAVAAVVRSRGNVKARG